MPAVLAIATVTLREALRGRLAWVLLVLYLTLAALVQFAGELALMERRQLQATLLAAGLRLATVPALAAFAITSVQRERDAGSMLMALALPAPRSLWVLGKLLGCAIAAAIPAAVCGLLLLPVGTPAACLLWATSLWCEAVAMAAFAILCALGLEHAASALAATIGMYLLARSIAGIQFAAHSGAASAALSWLAALMPSFDRFTRSEWVAYGSAGVADLGVVVLQAAIATTLFAAAAVLDFERKEL